MRNTTEFGKDFQNLKCPIIVGYCLLKDKLSRAQISAKSTQLLKYLAHLNTGTRYTEIVVEKAPTGAPRLYLSGNPVYCSISHKGNMMAAAMSYSSSVGLDIENLAAEKEYKRIRDYYGNCFFKNSHSTKSQFLQRWTIAEAYVKSTNTQLLEVLAKPFTIPDDHYRHFTIDPYLFCVYSAALATPTGQKTNLSVSEIDGDALTFPHTRNAPL